MKTSPKPTYGNIGLIFMAVKPELSIRKDWREEPGKLMLGRILGVLIALACIGLVVMNLR